MENSENLPSASHNILIITFRLPFPPLSEPDLVIYDLFLPLTLLAFLIHSLIELRVGCRSDREGLLILSFLLVLKDFFGLLFATSCEVCKILSSHCAGELVARSNSIEFAPFRLLDEAFQECCGWKSK